MLAGERVRVAEIDGITLEVEPLEGAAKDYREMRGKDDGTTLDEESVNAESTAPSVQE